MSAPAYNHRGVIAESYSELQGLSILQAAREAYPLPKASGESTIRAVFQSAEIALLNLADLLGRAAADIEAAAVGPASIKMFWARGFQRVLARLSFLPQQLGVMIGASGAAGVLRINDSPAFQSYFDALKRFDRAVLTWCPRIEAVIEDESLDSPAFNLLHLARVGNHESSIWERNLLEVRVPAPVNSYEEFVVARGMRDAVYDRVLSGDTYFTQFRGLHQIPETLGEEANDHCEQAIRLIRANSLRQAAEHLNSVIVLSEAILAALPPIADNLATSDYHDIRENLGLTSGSHSVCLRFHMFTHLYQQLWEELASRAVGRPAEAIDDAAVEEAFRAAAGCRFDDAESWSLHMLGDLCAKFRAFIMYWRDEHLHLPRNNLGGDYTKSLTGSPDAVKAVKHMRDGAHAKDPMRPLARAREHEPGAGSGPMTAYLDAAPSLDERLLSVTGRTTQSRFYEVQERLGFFASKCPFSPPPRRTV